MAATSPSPPKPTYRSPSTSISIVTWPAPARTSTRSLMPCSGSAPSWVGAERGQRTRPPVAGRDAVERLLELVGRSTAVSAPRLPQATPSTGLPDRRGGVQRGQRRAVPAERDHEVAVGRLAARRDLASSSATCTSSASWRSAQSRIVASAPSSPRRGWTASPMRSKRSSMADGYTRTVIVGRHGRPAQPGAARGQRRRAGGRRAALGRGRAAAARRLRARAGGRALRRARHPGRRGRLHAASSSRG